MTWADAGIFLAAFLGTLAVAALVVLVLSAVNRRRK
jgi:hypothetical protein